MRIDRQVTQQLLQIVARAKLDNLNPGDIIEGKVISLDKGLLFLKLTDGSSFTAKVPEEFSTLPGALLTLEIGEPVDNQLTAKILTSNPQNGNQAGINASSQPFEQSVQSQLKTLQDIISPKLVEGALKLLENNPALGVDKAAFLAANAMDEAPGMQGLFVKFMQREYQLDTNLTHLADSISQGLSAAAANPKTQEFIQSTLFQESTNELASHFVDQIAKQVNQLGYTLSDTASTAQKLADVINSLNNDSVPVDQEELKTLVKPLLDSLATQPGNPAQEERGGALQADKLPLPGSLVEKHLDEAVDGLFKGLKTLMSEKEGRVDSQTQIEPEQIHKLVKQIFDRASIKADQGVSEALDIKEKFHALKEAVQFANQAIQVMDNDHAGAAAPVIRDISQAMDFFNRVQTYHTFVQIPLVINNQSTSGELYVMKGKNRRGKIDPDQFTLFMSLNTENLGLIETFLNASRRYVTIHFRVSDENLVQMVREQHGVLYEAFAQKGYKLAEMKVRTLDEEPVNLVNAIRKTGDELGLNARVDLKI